MSGEEFIPLILATAGVIWASFATKKGNRGWLILASIIWLVLFLIRIGVIG